MIHVYGVRDGASAVVRAECCETLAGQGERAAIMCRRVNPAAKRPGLGVGSGGGERASEELLDTRRDRAICACTDAHCPLIVGGRRRGDQR